MYDLDSSAIDLQRQINEHRAESPITFRYPLFGGKSGAQVYLVDFEGETGQQLGVIKIASRTSAEKEITGYNAARDSWLCEYLSDRFEIVGTFVDGRVAVLSSLARDRLEDCETLEAILSNSIAYGNTNVVFGLAYAYRRQAESNWKNARTATTQDCFVEPVLAALTDGWEKNWENAQLPASTYSGLVFEDQPERWPNPVSYLLRSELWQTARVDVKVPWIPSHGDLNSRNVLSLSHQRAYAHNLIQKSPTPDKILEHLSLIDLPFFRVAPFPYDLAFLISTLIHFLPDFSIKSNRQSVLQTYKVVLDDVIGLPALFGVHPSCNNFYEAVQTIVKQLKFAQSHFEKDTELAFFSCLAGASLWRAIKTVDRRDLDPYDRQLAVNLVSLSALALKALFKYSGTSNEIAGEDFRLWVDPRHVGGNDWTDTTRSIADRLTGAIEKGGVIVVFGRAFSDKLGLLSDADCKSLKNKGLDNLSDALRREISDSDKASVGAVSAIKPTAILDWSLFPEPRTAFGSSLSSPITLKPVLPSAREIDVSDRNAVYYFHWRGSFEDMSGGVGLTAPERNNIRSSFRDKLQRLCKKRSPNQMVIYVGVPVSDVREMHEDLQQIWKQRLSALYIGSVATTDREYFDEWNIKCVNGTADDFLAACEGFREGTHDSAVNDTSEGILLTIADVKSDEENNLTYSPGSKYRIAIPAEHYATISRAGHLYLDVDIERQSELQRDPREFFIGHRVQLEEVEHEIPVRRDVFDDYLEQIEEALAESRPKLVRIYAQPGAGASTLLQCIARELASRNVPTLVIDQGGNTAFDAIEKLAVLVARPLVVIADIEDVTADEVAGLVTRCGPARYPVVIVTSQRLLSPPIAESGVFLTNILSDKEKASLVERLSRFCSGINIGKLMHSGNSSLFMLSLMAFGGENVNINRFVAAIMECASGFQQHLIAVIAFFSRYGHRASSIEFLEAVSDRDAADIESELSPFRDLLAIRENGEWTCRHDILSEKVLQYYLTKTFNESWRYKLSDFAVQLFGILDGYSPAGDIFGDYVWCALNPRVDASEGETDYVPRLIWSPHDGIPENPGRHRVYRVAAEQFPENANIVSHFGKFLSEVEGKYAEAEKYLTQALALETSNSAIMHMIGMRYSDEIKALIKGNPATSRATEVQERIGKLSQSAHEWFDRARGEDIGSEYNYTAPMQLNIRLIEDEFQKAGVRSPEDDPSILSTEQVSSLFTQTERIVSDGLNFISPDKEKRRYFTQSRDELERLRGDLEKAIESFEKRLPELDGSHLSSAKVQLARLLRERGQRQWQKQKTKAAIKDFEAAQRHLATVLEDPARSYENIKLWFDCARYLRHWTRADLLDKLHSLDSRRPSYDSSFLLMCLYFADAVQTGSESSWRKCGDFQHESSRRFAPFAVRSYLREWLVRYEISSGQEFRIFPHHLFGREMSSEDSDIAQSEKDKRETDYRVRLEGTVSRIVTSTSAYLKIAPWGFEVFFKPRVKDKRFYKEDEGKARVNFFIAFTYDKPLAYDVTRL